MRISIWGTFILEKDQKSKQLKRGQNAGEVAS